MPKTNFYNRKALVKYLAFEHEMTQTKADDIISSILSKIVEETSKDKTVRFTNFGTFYKLHAKERNGVNPRTKEKVLIGAKTRLSFRSGSKTKGI
jgi:nucleoid DNA-binding protein